MIEPKTANKVMFKRVELNEYYNFMAILLAHSSSPYYKKINTNKKEYNKFKKSIKSLETKILENMNDNQIVLKGIFLDVIRDIFPYIYNNNVSAKDIEELYHNVSLCRIFFDLNEVSERTKFTKNDLLLMVRSYELELAGDSAVAKILRKQTEKKGLRMVVNDFFIMIFENDIIIAAMRES